jgi:hypothetical protein
LAQSIKLSSVVSDIMGVSAQAMLQALLDGERNTAKLAELAKGACAPKCPN